MEALVALLAPFWESIVRLFQWCARHVLQWWRRYSVRAGTGKRVAILVAQFDGDDNNGAQKTIAECLHSQLRDAIEVIVLEQRVDIRTGAQDEANTRATALAQRLLKSKNGDLLVWGRCKSREVLSLRMTNRIDTKSEWTSVRLTNDSLEIPTKYLETVGAAVAVSVLVAAQPSLRIDENYEVPALDEVKARVKLLSENIPEYFDFPAKALIFESLGLIHLGLGAQSGKRSETEDAIRAFEKSLEFLSPKAGDKRWVYVNSNLGAAFRRLAQSASDSDLYDKSFGYYRAALDSVDRLNEPFLWAKIQINLATALASFAPRASTNRPFSESFERFEEAIRVLPRAASPGALALAMNNFGLALLEFGIRNLDKHSLEKSRRMLEDAARTYDGVEASLGAAMAHANLGYLFNIMADGANGQEFLRKAISHLKRALKAYRHRRSPWHWLRVQVNLGSSYLRLGELDSSGRALRRAFGCFSRAADKCQSLGNKFELGTCRSNLGLVLVAQGCLKSEKKFFDQAQRAFAQALEVFTLEHLPMQWAMVQSQIGFALMNLGRITRNTPDLQDAVSACDKALSILTPENGLSQWAFGIAIRSVAKVGLGAVTSNVALVRSGREDLEMISQHVGSLSYSINSMIQSEIALARRIEADHQS